MSQISKNFTNYYSFTLHIVVNLLYILLELRFTDCLDIGIVRDSITRKKSIEDQGLCTKSQL
jgi:hypothetical protein